MTLKETTEIFSVLMLAYPNAEMFKGGMQKLGPTIKLWTQCLGDVDFWTAQQAVIKLCKVCKFPPTIAELREQVDNVNAEIESSINDCIQLIRMWEHFGDLEEHIAQLPKGDILAIVVARLGGVPGLTETHEHNGETFSMWRWEEFRKQYRNAVKTNVLPGGSFRALPGAIQERT